SPPTPGAASSPTSPSPESPARDGWHGPAPRETARRRERSTSVMNGSYLIRRLLQVIPLLVGVSILGFAMMQLAPGGFAALHTLNPKVSSQDIERIKEAWGLNPPLWQQYLPWAGHMFVGHGADREVLRFAQNVQ